MERYKNVVMCTAGMMLMMMAVSTYSFINSPEYQLYSNIEKQAEILPQPDSMLLSQK